MELTFELSTTAFVCECGVTVEPNSKILFVDDSQKYLCNDCIRPYLKRLISSLEDTDETYAIIDNTSPFE